MIHSSMYKPTIIPIYVDDVMSELDRIQELTATTTLNRTKIEEVGRVGIVDWRKTTPSVSVTLRQLEYGNLEIYRKLANKGASVTTINFTDFKTTGVDICGYKTDDAGTYLGTIYYPDLRINGLSLNIGDPDSLIERRVTLVGEDELVYENANKYLIRQRCVIATGGLNKTCTIASPSPVADPDNSGMFLQKVVKVSGGVATKLTWGTDWSYDGASTLYINGSSSAGDVIWVWYTATTYLAGVDPFTVNDVDVAGISADSCSIFLESANYLYRLQSVAIDSTFNRFDVKEIGNDEIVARGVRDITNRITLGRILEAYTIEEILRGKAGTSYGKIDPRRFTSNMNLIVKIYSDSTKKTFKIGYKYLDVAGTGVDTSTPLNDYVRKGVTLECEEAFICTQENIL
jgi:hypothetical protein